jgi:glycosyltransferase involved in cell wall biosynthesis
MEAARLSHAIRGAARNTTALEATFLACYLPDIDGGAMQEQNYSQHGHHADESGFHRLVYVVTAAATAEGFLRGQLRHMQSCGFEVTLIASPDPALDTVATREGIAVYGVPMSRSISIAQDLRSLLLLLKLFRELRPHIVNVGTPKAGLLAGVAAVLCHVPRRIYTLHGLRLEGATGRTRKLLTTAEWIACRSAHTILCVSHSLRDRVVSMRLAAPSRVVVLGQGSCNGVDTARFRPAEASAAAQLRRSLGIRRDAPVIGYVGRLTRDKGIRELVEAYVGLRVRRPDLHLLLVGDHDETDPLDADVRRVIDGDNGVTVTGWVADPTSDYHCMNVFALPSYREGLGQTALEAAASQVPVVTTDATGARDAVIDGVTGIRVPQGDAHSLAAALARLLDDPTLAGRLGRQGRDWVCQAFAPEHLWTKLAHLYRAPPQ